MIVVSTPPGSVLLAVLAALAYSVPALWAERLAARTSVALVLLAWVLHGCVIAAGLLASPASFGFAPALSVTAWLVAAAYGVEHRMYPQLRTRWSLAGLGALAVLLGTLLPGHQLPAQASIWLPIHLLLGLASYGLFGTAVVHAWLMGRAETRFRMAADPHAGLPLLTLERLTFRFVGAGFALLSLTLLIGMVFGDSAFGRSHAWRWDHKTVFSVLAWLTFATLLGGRFWLGWRGRRAVKMLYTGTTFLLLAYVGSRFVMEMILGRTP